MPDTRGRPTRKNGATGASIGGLAVADGAVAAMYDDPMSKVLGLDAQTSGPIAWVGYFLGAIALLLGMMVTARVVTLLVESMDAQAAPAQADPQEIDVVREEPPPPPPRPGRDREAGRAAACQGAAARGRRRPRPRRRRPRC